MANQRSDQGPGADSSHANNEVAAQRLMLGEVNVREAFSRSRGAGETRLNVEASHLLMQVGQLHNTENFFHWVAMHEGRNSESFYLTPTDENDPHRLAVDWSRAGKNAAFTMRKVLIAKQIKVPKGHNLICPCNLTEVQGEGAALEVRFGERTLVPIVVRGPRKPKHGTAPATTPTTPMAPTEQG